MLFRSKPARLFVEVFMMSGPVNLSPSEPQQRHLLALLDLTRLEEDSDPEPVRALCAKALASPVRPAAVCVYPQFIDAARAVLGDAVKVANFPDGAADARIAALECEQALEAGADEVDVVFPWRALMNGDARGLKLSDGLGQRGPFYRTRGVEPAAVE